MLGAIFSVTIYALERNRSTFSVDTIHVEHGADGHPGNRKVLDEIFNARRPIQLKAVDQVHELEVVHDDPDHDDELIILLRVVYDQAANISIQ